MIYWAPFLHFYQPPIQFPRVLKRICNESYRPLVKMFLKHKKAKVTINICGVLTELLDSHGAEDIINDIGKLALSGQLEFVDSGKYHPIFPLIPQREIQRQLKLNHKANKAFFGKVYKPKGVFPPEMGYSEDTAKVIKALGYKWILLAGVACSDAWPFDFIPEVSFNGSSILVFYRDDILSNKISFQNLDSASFIKELAKLAENKEDSYLITAMDAETFGHHIQNWEEIFLAEAYKTISKIKDMHQHSSVKQRRNLAQTHKNIFFGLKEIPQIEVVTISELLYKFSKKKAIAPKPSSWSTTKDDICKGDYYPLWKGVGNRIHDLQWEHINICFSLTEQALSLQDNKEANRFGLIARGLLDRAIYSCQFWWANKNRGTWDINLINKGLLLQEEVVLNAYKAISISALDKAAKKNFYSKVVTCREVAVKIRDLLLEEWQTVPAVKGSII